MRNKYFGNRNQSRSVLPCRPLTDLPIQSSNKVLVFLWSADMIPSFSGGDQRIIVLSTQTFLIRTTPTTSFNCWFLSRRISVTCYHNPGNTLDNYLIKLSGWSSCVAETVKSQRGWPQSDFNPLFSPSFTVELLTSLCVYVFRFTSKHNQRVF